MPWPAAHAGLEHIRVAFSLGHIIYTSEHEADIAQI